jgi:hypothetical protein
MNRRAAVVLAAAFAVLAAGCASTALTAAGSKVQLMKADPPQGCREIGNVDGTYNFVGSASEGDSKNVMRNRAAELGANYVRWESVSPNGMVAGTAFQCP